MSGALDGHARIDRRSLLLHRSIAEKLRANPALLRIGRENLDRWSAMHGRSQPYWDSWRGILARPLMLEGERAQDCDAASHSLRRDAHAHGTVDSL